MQDAVREVPQQLTFLRLAVDPRIAARFRRANIDLAIDAPGDNPFTQIKCNHIGHIIMTQAGAIDSTDTASGNKDQRKLRRIDTAMGQEHLSGLRDLPGRQRDRRRRKAYRDVHLFF